MGGASRPLLFPQEIGGLEEDEKRISGKSKTAV
jgi:hypothetical protein